MDFFDFKCGHCGTVFSVKLSEYRKRIDHIENPMRLIRCPSCCSILPPFLRDYVKQLIDADPRVLENWKFGTRLHDTHRCINQEYADNNNAAQLLTREFRFPRNR